MIVKILLFCWLESQLKKEKVDAYLEIAEISLVFIVFSNKDFGIVEISLVFIECLNLNFGIVEISLVFIIFSKKDFGMD